jgi:hypothetical protein
MEDTMSDIPAPKPVSKTGERLTALAYAVIVVLTFLAAILSFVLAANGIHESLVPAGGVTVFVIVALNFAFSLVFWFYGRTKLTGMDSKKAYDLSGLAALGVFWDIVGMALALALFGGWFVYVALGVVLTVDCITDAVVHIKR